MQRRMVYELAENPKQLNLILAEHNWQITMGRAATRADILLEDEEREKLGWPIYWVPRGGGAWLHGPGQLQMYLLRKLPAHSGAVNEHLTALRSILFGLMQDLGLLRVEYTHAGIVHQGRSLARIGFGVQDSVTTFGAMVNISVDLLPFQSIHCDGISESMTSIERELTNPIRPGTVRQRLVERTQDSFNCSRLSVFHHLPGMSPKASSNAIASRNRESHGK